MALHPFRAALGQAALRAFRHDATFKPEADAALARFQSARDDLERQIQRGDLTLKVARAKAEAAAEQLKADLGKRAEGFSPTPRVFLDRLVDADNARKRARDRMSAESLQRETNRLLRQTLIEQQLQNRAPEFEGKAYVRSMTGGPPAPTLSSLLSFHETAALSGDDAAAEWARRRLEAMRGMVSDPADVRRIDLACDRPDAVNPRLVASYVEAIGGGDSEAVEPFVHSAIEGRDANACVAAFLLARGEPKGTSVRWVRDVLDGLPEFPDAALATLRAIEAEARAEDAESARAHADYAVALASARVRFSGVEPPTESELSRRERIQAKPVAHLGQPIGLALDRRGFAPEELAGLTFGEGIDEGDE